MNFNIDSFYLDNCGNTNIYNIIEFVERNPHIKLDVYGYADEQTGTPQHNLWLSKRRAEEVRKYLVTRGGVSPSKVFLHFIGSDEQYYSINNYNRCVIVTAHL